MTSPHIGRMLMIATGIALCCLLWCDSALGQCAMCRASLGSNSSFIRNVNIGVLVLLIPPVSIFCTIFIVAFRYRK